MSWPHSRVSEFFVQDPGKTIEGHTHVGGIRLSTLVDNLAEHHDFSGPKKYRRTPV